MRYLLILLFLTFVLVLLGPLLTSDNLLEEFRGGGGHRGGGHRGGGHGGGGHRGGGHRRGRRRWFGQNWGYRYRPPPRFVRYNPWTWFGGRCKNGCTSIGGGGWGCQYPGSGPNDCWFANDCYGCGY